MMNSREAEFVSNFRFQKRQGYLDWRKIISVNLEQVVATRDLAALDENLHALTYADLTSDDIAMFSEETNVVQLFRLSQLTLEFLVQSNQMLRASRNDWANEVARLQALNEKLETKVKDLKRQLKDANKNKGLWRVCCPAWVASSSSFLMYIVRS
jgi:hypothetical protein